MLTVCHTTRYYLPHIGGTEQYIASLISSSGKAYGYDVRHIVIATNRRRYVEGPLPSVPVKRFPVIGPQELPYSPGGLFRLWRVRRQFDVIHVHDVRFLALAITILTRLARIPVVLTTHGLIWHTGRHSLVKRLFARTVLRGLLSSCTIIMASSAEDAKHIGKEFTGKLRLWENPVDIGPFLSVRHQIVELQGTKRLLYFGRLDRNKGLEDLFAALSGCDEYSVEIVGRGDERYVERLKNLATSMRVKAHFFGYQPTESVVRLMEHASAIVLPSVVEGFGLVLVEAMASGLPVVARDIGPFRAISEGTDVLLVDFRDREAVLSALALAGDLGPSLRNQRRAQRFDWSGRVADLHEMYKGVQS